MPANVIMPALELAQETGKLLHWIKSPGDMVRKGPAAPLLPHPRLAERGFVLLPLREIKPDWRHPVSGRSLDEMITAMPPGQIVRPLPL